MTKLQQLEQKVATLPPEMQDGNDFAEHSIESVDKLKIVPHPDAVKGDPEDLVDISWEHEINLDFPK